jgi:hypothetical protein
MGGLRFSDGFSMRMDSLWTHSRRIGRDTNDSRKPKAPLERGLRGVPEEGLEPPTRGL